LPPKTSKPLYEPGSVKTVSVIKVFFKGYSASRCSTTSITFFCKSPSGETLVSILGLKSWADTALSGCVTNNKVAVAKIWQTNWLCPSEAERFCKNDSDLSFESLSVTRVEPFCEKCDLSRVTIVVNVTRVESEPPKVVTRAE